MSGRSGTDRRRVLKVLTGSAGAGLALPAAAAQHEAPHHAAVPANTEPPAIPANAGFLDAHQLDTVASLAETIIPGSTAAAVAPFVDRLLAVDTQESQREFLAALGAIQAESAGRYLRPWLGLTSDERAELLTAASTAKPSRNPRYWTPGQPVLVPEPPPVAPTLRDHFDLLKRWIATAYWSSEAGMRELGWTGSMIHEAFEGCPDPGRQSPAR